MLKQHKILSRCCGREYYREHMMNVEKLGGKVLGEPVDIPGVGLYVPFIQPF